MRDSFKSRGQQMLGLSVVMTELYVHWYKMILRRIEVLKRQFNQSTESSNKVAESIAKRRKSFTPLHYAIFYGHANMYFGIKFCKLAHW